MSKIMGKNKVVVIFLMQIHFDCSFFAIIFFHKKTIIRVFTILQIGYTWFGKTAQNEFSYDKRRVINNNNNPSYMRICFYSRKNIVNMQFLIISKFLGANDSKANQ